MHEPLRSTLRLPAALLLLLVAGAHVPLIGEHLEEAPYVGLLFVALTVAALAGAVLLVRRDTSAVWAANGLLSLLAIAGFLVSRTAGLPQLGDDVGNWTEPLAFPAIAAETLATSLAAVVLTHRPGHHHRKGTS